MSDVSFDTHAEIRKLEQSGIPLPQAEALTDMVARAPVNAKVVETLEYLKVQVDTNMATKTDIAEIRARFDAQRDEANVRYEAINARFDAQRDEFIGRFDAQRDEVIGRFDAQRDEANARFEGVNAQFEAQSKDIKAGFAESRADLYRALWLQGSALAALILALAGVVVAYAVASA